VFAYLHHCRDSPRQLPSSFLPFLVFFDVLPRNLLHWALSLQEPEDLYRHVVGLSSCVQQCVTLPPSNLLYDKQLGIVLCPRLDRKHPRAFHDGRKHRLPGRLLTGAVARRPSVLGAFVGLWTGRPLEARLFTEPAYWLCVLG
jgi:hypothetical protein